MVIKRVLGRFVGAAPTSQEPAEPSKLEGYLEKEGKTPKDLLANSYALKRAAREMLKAKGIEQPTKSQVHETQYLLQTALKNDTWKEFSAPFEPKAIHALDGVSDRVGNIFFEKHPFSAEDLKLNRLRLTEADQGKLYGDFESGRLGMVLTAGFINTNRRSEGDFSRAYGEAAWRGFMRAYCHLQSIPKGKLLESFDVDLLCKVNELSHAPDEGVKAGLLRAISALGRGGRFDKGGRLRRGSQYASAEKYTPDEVKRLQAAGIQLVEVGKNLDGTVDAILQYPAGDVVEARTKKLITDLKKRLEKPNADPVLAAALFQRDFVALHPFEDSNGRTSRLLMNRILQEFDLPPAIFHYQNRDLGLTTDAARRRLAEGVARTKMFLKEYRLESKANYISQLGIKAIESSPDAPIVVDGNLLDLGTDGLLYSPTGRPWMAVGDELVPMSQLDHYIFSRRLLQMGKEKGTEQLLAISEETRALHARLRESPDEGASVRARASTRPRQADAEYQLRPEPEIGRLLASMSAVDKLDKAELFKIERARGTDISSAISKYTQVDLELWYLEQGLRRTGDDTSADSVRGERAKLFDLAKGAIDEGKDETRVSDENPMGFKFKYEQMMYEACPLRAESFEAAVKAWGDDEVTAWRGDYGFARLLGMAPNNDVRRPSAKTIARRRQKKGQITNLYDDLNKLESSARGRQYICATSDLALLGKAFATSKKSETVNLDAALPGFLADMVVAWVGDGKADEVEKDDAAQPARSATSKKWNREIEDTFGVPGTLLSLRVKDKETRKVEVLAQRKAFEMRLNKGALLPGIMSLGGPRFVNEQELHGIERVYPWQIKSTHEAKSLLEEFPEVRPAKVDAPDVAEDGDASAVGDEPTPPVQGADTPPPQETDGPAHDADGPAQDADAPTQGADTPPPGQDAPAQDAPPPAQDAQDADAPTPPNTTPA